MPPPESSRHLMPLVEPAILAHRQGSIETAERLCPEVLESVRRFVTTTTIRWRCWRASMWW